MQSLNISAQDLTQQVELGQFNVKNNVPQPSLLLHIQEKLTRNAFFSHLYPGNQEGHNLPSYEPASISLISDKAPVVNGSFMLNLCKLCSCFQYIGL
jgi:hypothetical protein